MAKTKRGEKGIHARTDTNQTDSGDKKLNFILM